MVKVYIPRDSTALSVGADRTAKAIQAEAEKRGADITIIRNGSRGLFWIEPMIEVETPKGRVAYAPVKPKDVASLFDADFINGGDHALSLGLTEEIPYLKNQQRLTFGLPLVKSRICTFHIALNLCHSGRAEFCKIFGNPEQR